MAALFAASCSDEMLEESEENVIASQEVNVEHSEECTDSLKADFAKALSAALTDRQDVREFLKQQALIQFDNNYDILYQVVKNQDVSGETFKDILAHYSSEEKMNEIENAIPLLNIYLTRIAPLGVYPEDLDTSAKDIPTAVAMQDSTRFYENGENVETLAKGEIPDFHVFVVGENSRVVIDDSEGSNLKSVTSCGFRFKDPVFDGSTKEGESNLKSIALSSGEVGNRAIEAYKYFYKSDNSVNQKGLQRDYIYYGITPQKQQGSLNRSASEHISKIKVDPKTFFKIRDHQDDAKLREDPDIIQDTHLSVGHTTSKEDLINIMWSKGTYDFRFDVIKSNEETAESVYVPARPEDLLDFHIEYWYRHKTRFRHSRHHYSIDPNKFTAKVYTPSFIPNLGKWNVAEESLYRYVNVWEEDKGTEIEDKYSY